MYNQEYFGDESETPGWVSMSDVLIVTTILLLSITFSASNYATSQRVKSDAANGALSILQEQVSRIPSLERDLKKAIQARDQALKDLAKANADVISMQEQVAHWKSQAATYQQLAERLQKELPDVKSQLVAEKMRTSSLMIEIEVANTTIQQLGGDLKVARNKLDETMLKLKSAEEMVARYLKDKTEFELRITKLTMQLDVKEAKLVAAEKQNQQYQKQLDALRTVLGDPNANVTSVVSALNKQKKKIEDYELLLKERNDQILAPLETAKLTIRIQAINLRDDLDLDLYVQDPEDRLCYWRNPRVLTEHSEVATLIPSEDLRKISKLNETSNEDAKGPADRSVEEAYYAAEPMAGGREKPYLIFCMLRQVGGTEPGVVIDQEVEWIITIKHPAGDPTTLKGKGVIPKTGGVLVSKDQTNYPGLKPLTGFAVIEGTPHQIFAIAQGELPPLLRGWTKTAPDRDPKAYRKLRDKKLKVPEK